LSLCVIPQPGGGPDAFLRTAALYLNNEGIVKPKIFVSNKLGGSGTLSINYLASKKGDPNVLLGWTTSPLATLLRGTTTVKDVMDLVFLCALSEDANFLVVRGDSKYKVLKDLIDDARNNPDKVKGGVGSVGSTEHILINRVEKAAGVKFNVTSFGSNSYVQLLGGHIDFTFATQIDVMQSVSAGKLRILAAAGDTRSPAAPNAATMKEQGVSASFRQVRGLCGPPEMPDYAIKFWGQAFAKLSEIKGFKDNLRKFEMDPIYMGPEELKKFIPGYAKELAADIKDLEVYGGAKKN
jgi:putative tricarboxylic transport membrane protein